MCAARLVELVWSAGVPGPSTRHTGVPLLSRSRRGANVVAVQDTGSQSQKLWTIWGDSGMLDTFVTYVSL